jgi:hypothetical protein
MWLTTWIIRGHDLRLCGDQGWGQQFRPVLWILLLRCRRGRIGHWWAFLSSKGNVVCLQKCRVMPGYGSLAEVLVKFEFGQQSVKLTLLGISTACNELSLERLILILTYLVLVDSVCSRILGQGRSVSRWLQVSRRIGLRPSPCCGSEIELPLVRTRYQGRFFKNGGSLRRPQAMWWCDDAIGVVSRLLDPASWWSSAWLVTVELRGWSASWSISSWSDLRGRDEKVTCAELQWRRFLCSRACVTQLQNSMFNAMYHFRSRRGHQVYTIGLSIKKDVIKLY